MTLTTLPILHLLRRAEEVDNLEVAIQTALANEDKPLARKLLKKSKTLLFRLEHDLS